MLVVTIKLNPRDSFHRCMMPPPEQRRFEQWGLRSSPFIGLRNFLPKQDQSTQNKACGIWRRNASCTDRERPHVQPGMRNIPRLRILTAAPSNHVVLTELGA